MKKLYWLALFALMYCAGLLLVSHGWVDVGTPLIFAGELAMLGTLAWMAIAAIEKKSGKK